MATSLPRAVDVGSGRDSAATPHCAPPASARPPLRRVHSPCKKAAATAAAPRCHAFTYIPFLCTSTQASVHA
eukprot:350444-Chlamydomonas_euryale.AAC.5